jgi:hypothetical protein
MLVRLDINLKFTGPEHFEVGSVDIIDQHVYQTFARNLGFPAHLPLFKENPESALSRSTIIPSTPPPR